MRNFGKEDERLEMVLRTTTVTKKKFEVVEFEKKKKKKKKTLHNVYCWVIDSFWAETITTNNNKWHHLPVVYFSFRQRINAQNVIKTGSNTFFFRTLIFHIFFFLNQH